MALPGLVIEKLHLQQLQLFSIFSGHQNHLEGCYTINDWVPKPRVSD